MKKIRVGSGFDVHAFGPGDHITLGGIKIKHNTGLVAHSDGDVLIHSVCDAILGALSLGDIGSHFPDNNQSFKNIDSRILLEKVCAIMLQKNYEIGNIDCTICAQAPRMREHIDAMRGELSRVMNIDIEDISIKATTTERLGFVGRSEGIAVYATILLFAK